MLFFRCHFERYMALSREGLAVAQPYHEERPMLSTTVLRGVPGGPGCRSATLIAKA